jgi:tetratricopeptide (TPR) repeat protein
MDPAVYPKFREALRMLSFGRHGMAAEALEELAQARGDPDCRYWLAYVYRRMRRYDKALPILETLPRCRDELEKVQAERRSYELFRQALELQGRGELHKMERLLEQAREEMADDPELQRWIEEELDFCRASLFDGGEAP